MGFGKILKFIAANSVRSDNQKLPMSENGLNNESYRKALEQFLNRRRSYEVITDAEFVTYESINQSGEYKRKGDNQNRGNDLKLRKRISFIPGVPHIPSSEIFEIGHVAGTEDRYLELATGEWHNMRVSLKRHTDPACDGAINVDIEILTQIRHPNVLLLIATMQTNEHGLVSIFEPIECTLYNYIHEQGERISTQEIARLGMTLADALKYCHMRGYVHGALSSHCIYFTPDGTIKIGGWEMAITENNKVERDYEKCLRTEIFRWQAPEFFYGFALTTKSDVYGLSLLLWEITTARIPWHGCNRPHVERQYANQRSGIIMNLRAFPPRLEKILENGLQLDVTKRTIDMDKIRRSLRTMISEEEVTYINQTKNNNDSGTIYPLSTKKISSTSPSKDTTLIKRPFVKQLGCHINEEKLSNKFLKSKKTQFNKDFDIKTDIGKNDVVNNQSQYTTVKHATNRETTNHYIYPKQSNVIKEHRSDEGSHSTARSNIKRLKEMIANRRENFFHENEPSIPSYQTPNQKNAITLSHTNSNPDYVLCKPASHATNMELKYRKSHGEYEGTMKLSHIQKCKSHTPYTNMSSSIKDAIVLRKTLHSDPQSFYESTLWRKEKLICLSRMGRSKMDDQIRLQKPIIPTNSTVNNEETQYIKSNLANDTYTIKNISEVTERKLTEDNKESSKDEENSHTSMKTLISPDQSLQNLKDALDRAANIVRSATPYKRCSSPFPKNNSNFEVSTDNMQKREMQNALEDIYRTKHHDNNDQKIKDIERPTSGDKNFLEMDKYTNTESNIEVVNKHKKRFDCDSSIYYSMYNTILTKDNGSMEETSNESQILTQDQWLKDLRTLDQDERVYTTRNTSTPQKTRAIEDFRLNREEFTDTDTISLQSNNIARCKNCQCEHTYDSMDLLRRFSLPSKLNQLEINHNPSFRKYAPKKPDGDNTVEDLYIDDEFGSHLNDHLILFNDDLQLLDDYIYNSRNLPQVTEL